jgi:hypothetical protein
MTMMTKLATSLLAGALTLAVSARTFYRAVGETAHAAPSPLRSACDDWYKKFSDMPPEHRDALKRGGVVFTSGYFLLSEDLVSDCELRGQMSSYFTEVFFIVQDGNDNRKFAAAHSKEIVAALRRIWPTLSDKKALIVDTSDIADPDEKYALLGDPALEEADLAPLISDILKAETIDNNLARLLFARPMQGVKPTILDMQKEAEEQNDFRWQILNLAVLQKMGDKSALPKFRKLLRNKDLPRLERKYVATLLSKADRGEDILFSDVERLEYEDTAGSGPYPQ